ncbi:unnamed protein product [Musa hybrid cultivar]
MGNHHRARFTLMTSSFIIIIIMFWLAALQPAEVDAGRPIPSRWVDPDLQLPSLPQGTTLPRSSLDTCPGSACRRSGCGDDCQAPVSELKPPDRRQNPYKTTVNPPPRRP